MKSLTSKLLWHMIRLEVWVCICWLHHFNEYSYSIRKRPRKLKSHRANGDIAFVLFRNLLELSLIAVERFINSWLIQSCRDRLHDQCNLILNKYFTHKYISWYEMYFSNVDCVMKLYSIKHRCGIWYMQTKWYKIFIIKWLIQYTWF